MTLLHYYLKFTYYCSPLNFLSFKLFDHFLEGVHDGALPYYPACDLKVHMPIPRNRSMRLYPDQFSNATDYSNQLKSPDFIVMKLKPFSERRHGNPLSTGLYFFMTIR